ncbi:MAG: hypothetical protein AAGF95_25600 [Chloroflexota bacterium]
MAGLQIPLDQQGSAHANEAFRRCRSADRQEVLEVIDTYLLKVSDFCITILDVGVGDGTFDELFIEQLQQKSNSLSIEYTAVEPNQAQLQGFAERLNTTTQFRIAGRHATCAR